MATGWYFWQGVQHLCGFNIVTPLIYHLLPNVWKAEYTIIASIFVIVLYWLPYSMGNFNSCIVPDSLQWFFHFGKVIIIAWTQIEWVWWMFQNILLPAAQEVRDSSSSVTPCIVMKNDEVLYHQVSSFSPEHWMEMLQECAVVDRVYRLP